jgi:uncharacterized protein (TIGR03437 family)
MARTRGLESREGGLFTCFLGLLSGCALATAQSAPSLAVDAGANQHSISPYIYGINDYSDDGLGNVVRVGARRWGGDATLRYNYLIDTWNSAADYYFENSPQNSTGPLPDGSVFNLFVNTALSDGSLRVGTIPILDWLPKDRGRECSYSVALYGSQQSVDPYDTDCGNGYETNGKTPIVDTDLTMDGEPNGTSFAQAWIQYLIGRYGSANRGGVQVWSLGNEPDWWYAVHMDIHPETGTYDEILSRGQTYAIAIKQADPDALVTGQVAAGWSGMFYSSTDFVSGWNTAPYMFYDNPVDQNAHGGVGLTEWYLQQMSAYEQQHGRRLLDYVDVHAYIAPNNISFQNNAGDPTIDSLRLTSTREFWDPNYVPPPGPGATVSPTPSPQYPNGEPPYLVPRMLEWVAKDYPGTKTAITEYNWGALNDITGAIAQADLLGIFGREGLDLATIWAPPDPNPATGPPDPGVFAFKMYLNYDGNGSQFGETSVSATTGDPDELSIFAALRSDNALTVLVLNKNTSSANAPISVANFQAAGNAQVWQYSAADLTAIQRLSDLSVTGGSVTATVPARSITLLVLPALTSSLPAPKPVIAAVGNAASYNQHAISPGELVVIFGTNLGPKVLAGPQLTEDGNFLAQSTGNVRVLFNGFIAPMVYSSATQVSAVVPYEAALSPNAAVQVEVQGVRSDPFMIPVAAAVPAIFTANASGAGQGSILNHDTTVNSSTNPAASGQTIVMFATGEGQTNPPGVDGRIQFDVMSTPVGACAATIGGQTAVVNYCGMAPHLVSGVLQINAVVPAGAGTGNVPVSFSIGGVSSPPGVTVALK